MFENNSDIKPPEWLAEAELIEYKSLTTDFLNTQKTYNLNASISTPSSSSSSYDFWMPTASLLQQISPQQPPVQTPKQEATSLTIKPVTSTTSTQELPNDKKTFVKVLVGEYYREIAQYNAAHENNKIDTKYVLDLVAHDTIESAWGNHALGFNLGGIKVTSQQIKEGVPYIKANTFEYINGKKVHIKDNFRKFNSIGEYVKFKIKMLTEGRYAKAGVFHGDYVHTLKTAGYFTAPESTYKNMLTSRKKQIEKLLQ